MSTPHNAAENGQFAKVVLMPGDPLRAKFIAENFLEDAVCVTSVRGMLGYTGTYKGHPVSVMGHGMGMASVGIYSYELFAFYGVERIIRIGSAGGMNPELDLGDIVIAQGACTDSNFAAQYELPGTYAPIADYKMMSTAATLAAKNGYKHMIGNVLSSDVFYVPNPERAAKWLTMGVLCAEMECAALFMNAAFLGKRAMGLLTISDLIGSERAMSAEERQTKFKEMMTLALETAISE
ncbi:MAG: purine-nucleoside phosphorylase [Angelakisella sp.]